MLPDPYEGYEKERVKSRTAVELEIYGYLDPTSAGHFLRGQILDSSGGPVAHGDVNMSVNGIDMGNATSDIEGCFNFKDWKFESLRQDRDSALKEGKAWRGEIVARYYGDDHHSRSIQTSYSKQYVTWPTLPTPSYEITWPEGSNSISIVQGGTADLNVNIRPYSNEYKMDNMLLNLWLLPCAIEVSVASHNAHAAVDDPASYTFSVTAKEYAEPGRYFIQMYGNNPFVKDPTIGGFWLEILPKR